MGKQQYPLKRYKADSQQLYQFLATWNKDPLNSISFLIFFKLIIYFAELTKVCGVAKWQEFKNFQTEKKNSHCKKFILIFAVVFAFAAVVEAGLRNRGL